MGSPAHAGMHPGSRCACPRRPGFPRARGDAPAGGRERRREQPVPPRTRGCTLDTLLEHAPEPGSPAHAGMHPSGGLGARCPTRFPRARGDAPCAAADSGSLLAVPPRTRGCTRHRVFRRARPLGSPAHAGMHPIRSWRTHVRDRFPRARGDAPCSRCSGTHATRVPPRTRGCTRGQRRVDERGGGSPAHAGMHPRRHGSFQTRRWFPRARGDAPGRVRWTSARRRVPPRTRGCTLRCHLGVVVHVGSPAHAGMHPEVPLFQRVRRGFPRARGDAPMTGGSNCADGAVPPRTRGCTLINCQLTGTGGVESVPPRTRGCTPQARELTHGGRGSPAHAGMHLRFGRSS